MFSTSFILLLLAFCVALSTAARRSNPAPQFDVLTPLSRTWTLTRKFGPSTNQTSSHLSLDGPCKLNLGKDRVARFSTGETGVWGVKNRGTQAGKIASKKSKNSYDGSFDSGICLEIEVSSPSDGPIIVYSLPLSPGVYQPSSLRIGTGVISWLPGPFSLKATEIGSAKCELEMGKGIVDSSWARGRKWWWKGMQK
ncbi:hypothetical protein TrLO_g11094 [Triparma laevis f. longispina]|uniref:Uncharacterized protein n=1 Tax=Triparma laevis f. longispina TaxID=1714387 RepID=A0A9W7FIX2_9STRA|nr:hypothetical protein TrLO_g11094 [Triparma laevis f. longispina]